MAQYAPSANRSAPCTAVRILDLDTDTGGDRDSKLSAELQVVHGDSVSQVLFGLLIHFDFAMVAPCIVGQEGALEQKLENEFFAF
jgi:hypothetical protein